MVSKEDFNKVFKDTSREGILNQFYYEHIELRKMIDNFNELEKWIDEESKKTILSTGHLTCLMMCKNKLQELNGSDNNE